MFLTTALFYEAEDWKNFSGVSLIASAATFGEYNVGAINTAKIPDTKTSNLNSNLNFCIFTALKYLFMIISILML